MRNTLFIGTRASQLAVWQSTWVKEQIEKHYPDTRVELIKITTKGDKILDVPLAKVGGKGLFVKEIEDALLDKTADIAVHSMKDVPTELPEGLHLAIIPPREIAEDAFVSVNYSDLASLPQGAIIGTSSLRRKAQLATLRPDLDIRDLRGNLDTRLRKLDQGQYDGIILAGAGLKRLGLENRITSLFTVEEMLPAIGQGSLGLELRVADQELLEGLKFLHHQETASVVAAERAFLLRLEGGCQVPIGAHATIIDNTLHLTGLIASIDGTQVLKESNKGTVAEAAALGRQLADTLLGRGGKAILDQVYQDTTN